MKLLDDIEKKLVEKLPVRDKITLQRRLNKLKRDPEAFFKDSYYKRKEQIKKYLPLKYEGNNQFTIVSNKA